MGLFDQFPYTNFHELNLMWILEALKEIQTTTEQFVAINSLKYANPIQWNITSQYEKNTIVIDPQTGTAYISVQPVPTGVALTNEDYWTVVFDLGSFVTRAAKNFTTRWEEATTLTATFPTLADEWLVWGDTLYIANVNITAGDSYIVDGNIRRITIEEVKNEIYTTFNTMIGDLADLNTTDKSNLVAAINDVLVILSNITGNLSDLDTTDKSNLVAAINESFKSGDNNYCEDYRVYVNGTNGNDNNSGDINSPLKTIDAALEWLNKKETSTVITIQTAGTYKASKQVINGITLHIVGAVSGVIIDFSDQKRDIRFYNCHLNFNNITLKNDYNYGMTSIYFENCATSITNVAFTNHVIIYGGSLESEDCIFRAIRFRAANGWLSNSTFNNDDIDQSAVQVYYSSSLSLLGSFTHNDTLPSSGLHGMIRVERSSLYVAISSTNDWINNLTTYKYLYGLSGGVSIIMITREVYYILQQYSTTGTNSYLYDAIINNENAYLNVNSAPLLQIPANSNLNDYTTDGQYRTMSGAISATISNTPYTESGFRLDVIHLSTPYHVIQVLRGINYEGYYIRRAIYTNDRWTFHSWFTLKDFTSELRKQNPFLIAQTDIASSDNLNNYTTPGEYRCESAAIAASLSNCPYTASGFRLTVKALANSNAIVQEIEALNSIDGYYRRTIDITNSTYHTWYKITGTAV